MSNGLNHDSVEQSAKCPNEQSTFSGQFRSLFARVSPKILPIAMWMALLIIMTGSATAQSDVGDVYCGTGVETGITIVFGAIAGLGLPATGFYVCRAGLSYMRAGGNPEKKNTAKERLVMSGLASGLSSLRSSRPSLSIMLEARWGSSSRIACSHSEPFEWLTKPSPPSNSHRWPRPVRCSSCSLSSVRVVFWVDLRAPQLSQQTHTQVQRSP